MKNSGLINIACFLLLLSFFSSTGCLHGQVVESKTVFIDINSTTDENGPQIELLRPSFPANRKIETTDNQENFVLKITATSRISYVLVNQDLKVPDESGMTSHMISLHEGRNQINISAKDENGRHTELKYWIDYLAPVVSLEDRIRENSQYYGLIIGINEYQDDRIRDLSNPIADALSISECLIEEYTFMRENVTVLRNPKRAEIIDELNALRYIITKEDNLLIFYAGHGYLDKKANVGYWLPSDAKESSYANWLSNSDLVNSIRAIDSKHTLLISDACFSGAIFEETRSLNMEEEQIYDRYYEARSRKAMTSGAETEVSDKSVFVKYLVMYLKNNTDTYMTGDDLFYSIKDIVTYNSGEVGNIPQYGVLRNVGSEGGDFIFLKRKE